MTSPLTERDFAEVRGNVLREIARRRRRNAFVLAGSVVFAAVALVFVLMPRPVPQRDRAGEAAGAPPRTVQIARVPVALPVLSGAPAASPVPNRRHHRVHHHSKPAPPPVAIASIELQTSNPDIRIIWIPNKETE